MATLAMPSAEIVFDTMFAYQRSAALNSAIELDAVYGDRRWRPRRPQRLPTRVGRPNVALRILCDYLATIGLLAKSDDDVSPDAGIGGVPQQAVARHISALWHGSSCGRS